ncbi:MAG: glycoside hydrolase, family 3 domain protein [Pedosphaera sp.]|nr:glycoside hydrolase, family 3 domain protein [Pedosphaera sp.]
MFIKLNGECRSTVHVIRANMVLHFFKLISFRILFRVVLLSALSGWIATASFAASAYDKQVEALLARMTLDEKIGQMTQVDMNAIKDVANIQKYFLGSMLSGGDSDPVDNTPQSWANACKNYQIEALKTRLKIPLIYGIDAVHGHNNVLGAVIFPHNIGLGATRNPKLVEQASHITALEVAGTGIRWAFAPCVAVARNESWGRTYESFGESPDLVSELGAAATRGLQGRTLSDPASVLACPKHFLGDGGTQGGVDQGNTICDEARLRRIHLPPYKAAIKAGALSLMVSYSSWNGQKMSGNKHLLTDVLKNELGFQGFLVSDWAAIDQISTNYKADIESSINAGMDMVMIPHGPGEGNNFVDFITLLKQLVAEGKVPQSRIDDAVRRILRVKFEMGLFEHPFTDPALTASIGSDEHRQVARQCVRESLVLLKNDHKILPLSKKSKRLVVVGKAADDLGTQCGGWTITWQGSTGKVTPGGTTILEGIRHTVTPGTEVTFSADGSGAEGADAIIVVVGETPYAEMKGDRTDLHLPPADLALIAKAKAARVPVVSILLSGRPLILGTALDDSDAFIAAWLPGTEGQGVADILFGDYKPTGQLPRTWPLNDSQLSTDAAKTIKPLFHYGAGLIY